MDPLKEDAQKGAPTSPDKEGGLFLCPNCGSFIMKGVDSCPKCGIQLDSSSELSEEEKRKGSKKAKVEEEKPSLFMCPECGAFMSEDATTCPICDAEIEGEEEEETGPVEEETEESGIEVDTETDKEEAEVETRVCEVCKSEFPVELERCLICNTPVKGTDDISLETLETLEDMIEVMKCPLCGTELSKDAAACYNCGTEFSTEKTEYVEDEIDKFFKHLDKLETEKKDREETSVEETVEVPVKEIKLKPIPKLKKAATVTPKPTIRKRAAKLKPERKYEFLFYATIMTLIIHYALSQFGIDTIWYGAIILYGSLFVICVLLAFTMKEIRTPSRKLLFQVSGFLLSVSVPLRWQITGPNPFDIPLLAVGAILIIIGSVVLEDRRSEVWPIHLYLLYGVSLFFFSSLYTVGHLSVVLELQYITVWIVGTAFVLIGFVLMVYRKLFIPIILRTEDIASEVSGTDDESIDRRLPKRVYDDEVPWYSKASALLLLDRYQEALESAEIAIKINNKNEIAWVIKGNAQSKLGNQLDALKSFNEAIKLNPSYEVAWNNKGKCTCPDEEL